MIKAQYGVACQFFFYFYLFFFFRFRHEGLLNFIKKIIFKYFWPLCSVFSGFRADSGSGHNVLDKSQDIVFHSFVPDTSSFLLRSKASVKSAQT